MHCTSFSCINKFIKRKNKHYLENNKQLLKYVTVLLFVCIPCPNVGSFTMSVSAYVCTYACAKLVHSFVVPSNQKHDITLFDVS